MVDLTEKPIKFEYKGNKCEIYYNGLRPQFKVNGSPVSIERINKQTGKKVKANNWKSILKAYIDTKE